MSALLLLYKGNPIKNPVSQQLGSKPDLFNSQLKMSVTISTIIKL